MPAHKLFISGKAIGLHGCIKSPDFRSSRVLCSDPWDFVSLWLKKNHQKDALFYWEQARGFYTASLNLPELSAPLTLYYCFLNATKALLTAKSENFDEYHGVGGRTTGTKKSLDNEIVDFQGSGILPALCNYLGEPTNAGKNFSLKEIFWHLPFIHRAFCFTYSSTTELFIPLENQCFLRRDGSKEAWFHAEINKRYINAHTKNTIKPGFDLYENEGVYEIRRKRRFKWSGRDIESSLIEFSKYHSSIRTRIIPIYSTQNRWYLKKSVKNHNNIKNSSLVLIYAAMHRLSELSRYDPILFSGHFNVNHNWLLNEFIKTSGSQFIYGIASELTGLEFMKPDAF
jgi:hypothetical protein